MSFIFDWIYSGFSSVLQFLGKFFLLFLYSMSINLSSNEGLVK